MSEPQPTGVFEMPSESYHADPAEQPSLSASIAHILCTQSPAHAKAAHPRLNPHFERVEDHKFDLGKACHSVFLEGRDNIYIVHEDDWRKKVAQEARAYARSVGKVPLLAKHRDAVYAMLDALREKLDRHEAAPPPFTDGKPEQTLVWQEGDVTCRSRLDWLRDDHSAIDDYKTTSASANPDRWTRTMYGIGADVQTAFYLRGLKALTGADAEMRYLVQETYPPYELSVVSLAPDAMAVADAKVDWAIERWRLCLKSEKWAGYPTEVCYAELPAWEESRWLEKEAREEVAA